MFAVSRLGQEQGRRRAESLPTTGPGADADLYAGLDASLDADLGEEIAAPPPVPPSHSHLNDDSARTGSD
jgi:hypothetical protein